MDATKYSFDSIFDSIRILVHVCHFITKEIDKIRSFMVKATYFNSYNSTLPFLTLLSGSPERGNKRSRFLQQ